MPSVLMPSGLQAGEHRDPMVPTEPSAGHMTRMQAKFVRWRKTDPSDAAAWLDIGSQGAGRIKYDSQVVTWMTHWTVMPLTTKKHRGAGASGEGGRSTLATDLLCPPDQHRLRKMLGSQTHSELLSSFTHQKAHTEQSNRTKALCSQGRDSSLSKKRKQLFLRWKWIVGSLETAPSSERWDGGSDLPLELGAGGVEVDGRVFTLGSLLASPQRDGP